MNHLSSVIENSEEFLKTIYDILVHNFMQFCKIYNETRNIVVNNVEDFKIKTNQS